MGVIAEDVVRVRADTTGVQNDVESGFGKMAKRAAGVFAAAFAVQKVGSFLVDAVGEASNLNETMTKSARVFGDANKSVLAFAENSATKLGQSKEQAIGAAATFGNLFRALKIGPPAAAKMSTSMVKLGTDLASFNNVSPEEALEAIRSGLVGETEPLRKFGVNMNDATLRAQAMKMGLLDAGSTGGTALDPAIKAQAAYALIMDQTKLAQGDFARTSGGLANQQRILSAQWTDMKASIGGALLPVITQVAGFLTGTLIPAMSELGDIIGPAISGAFSAVSDAVGPFIGILTDAISQFQGLRDIGSSSSQALSGAAGDAFAKLGLNAQQTNAILGTIGSTFTELKAAVMSTVGPMIDFVLMEFQQIVAGIQANKAEIVQTLTTLLTVWKTTWLAALAVIRFVWPVVKTIISVAIKVIGDVIKVAMALINGNWSLAWQRIKTLVRDVLTGLIAIIRSILGQIVPLALTGARAIGEAIWNGLKSEVSRIPGQLKTLLQAIPKALSAVVSGAFNLAKSLGMSIVTGIVDGMSDLAGAVKDKIESGIKSGIDAVNPFSPIEEGAAKLLGEPIVAGTVQGLAGLAPAIRTAVEAGMRSGIAGVNGAGAPLALGAGPEGPGLAGAAGGPQVAIHGPVTIQTDDPRRFLDDLMSRAKR